MHARAMAVTSIRRPMVFTKIEGEPTRWCPLTYFIVREYRTNRSISSSVSRP